MAILSTTFLQMSPALATDYNRCLQFDGTNYAEASRNLIPVNGDYTVELMVYSTDKNLNKYAHYISQGAQPAPFYIGTDPVSKVRLGDTWSNTGYTMQNNRWVHLAIVHYSNNSGFFYVDGQLVKYFTQSYDTSKSGTVTRFGSQFFGNGGEFFAGCLDNVRIWSSVRTAKQIKDNWRLVSPQNKTGLIANYTFDNYYGFTDRIRSVNSENSDPSLTLTYRNSPLSLPESGSFISKSVVTECFNSNRIQNSAEKIPNVDQIVARTKYVTVAQMSFEGLADNSCVGVDLFIKGSNVPISTTVGIKQGGLDLLYIDTANFACHANPNSKFLLKPWSNESGAKSIYGPATEVPGCAGELPEADGVAMNSNQTFNLIGNATSNLYSAVMDRIKASNLNLPSTSIIGSSQKIYEFSGCHAKVEVARLQREESGKWIDAQPAEGWERMTFCDAGHPLQPFVNANFPDGTILRWYISDNFNWEVFSLPFVFRSSSNTNNQTSSIRSTPIASQSATSSKMQDEGVVIKNLAIPFAFNPIVRNNTVVINVTFNKVVEKGTQLALTSQALGYKSEKPLVGTISGKKGVLVIPKSKFSNLKSDPEISMQTTTQIEKSPVLKGKIPIKSLKLGTTTSKSTAQKILKPSAAPKIESETIEAVKCYKGNLARTFLANACPPGWTSKP